MKIIYLNYVSIVHAHSVCFISKDIKVVDCLRYPSLIPRQRKVFIKRKETLNFSLGNAAEPLKSFYGLSEANGFHESNDNTKSPLDITSSFPAFRLGKKIANSLMSTYTRII